MNPWLFRKEDSNNNNKKKRCMRIYVYICGNPLINIHKKKLQFPGEMADSKAGVGISYYVRRRIHKR